MGGSAFVRTAVAGGMLAGVLWATGCGGASAAGAKDGRNELNVVHAVELERLRGGWSGTFAYFDPNGSEPIETRVIASGRLARDVRREKGWMLHVEYPDKPGNGLDIDFSISEFGHAVGGASIVDKKVVPKGPLKLTTEERATDGSEAKPASIRRVLDVNANALTLSKFVRRDGEKKFVLRTEYRLAR